MRFNILALLLVFNSIETNYGKKCKTGSSCIALEKCPGLKYEIKKALIRKSMCGWTNESEMVCCNSTQRNVFIRPDSGHCGKMTISNKIFNGQQTFIGEFPWMAQIIYKGNYLCGGSLISYRHVLTAAHCVVDPLEPIAVRLGEWDMTKDPDCFFDNENNKICSRILDIPINKIDVHEKYSKLRRNHDIALIHISKKVVPTEFIMPICMPFDEKFQFEDRRLSVAGWGLTERNSSSNIMLKAEVIGQNYSKCENRFLHVDYMRDSQLCTLGENGEDTRSGDSGGPLMYINRLNFTKPKIFIVGITAYGNKLGKSDIPSVYTNISYYKDLLEKWIVLS